MKLNLTNRTEAALSTLMSAFESMIEYVDEADSKDMQEIYDFFRREAIQHFRCEQCMRIRPAGDEHEGFICKACAWDNKDAHAGNLFDLNAWVNRNK